MPGLAFVFKGDCGRVVYQTAQIMLVALILAVFEAEVTATESEVGASQAADSCIHCLCMRDSGCSGVHPQCDGPTECGGYFQIREPYYIDCGAPGRQSGESIETAWARCIYDYNCALTCVQNYVNRYKGMCPGKGQCEQMARLHNGGPNGCKTTATNGYWNAIKSCCECT